MLLTVLVAVVALVGADHHFPGEFNKIEERLDKVTARLVNLENKIHARLDPDRIKKAKAVRYLVGQIEGTGCAKNEFQCGGNDPQCVSHLMVCDGHNDCRNGNDEKRCTLPFHEGDWFEGHMVFDRCTKRQPDSMTLHFTQVRHHPNVFAPIARVDVDIGIDVVNDNVHAHVELPTYGWYNFGLDRIVLMPPEADRLGLVCQFYGGNWDRCVGEIKHEASAKTCARLIFVRKH